MMSWKEYKTYSRGWHGEEFFNFLIYRPIAYLVVKLTYSLPLTPNTFSLFGLISAFCASFALWQGTAAGVALGSLGIFVFSVFDSCDGLLARMKKNSSPLGELVDMMVDLCSSIGFFTGTLMGLQKLNGDLWYHNLIIPAGLVLLFHAAIYNYYKKMFHFYSDGNINGWQRERESFQRKLNNIPRSHWHRRFLVHLYLFFNRFQTSTNKEFTYDKEGYTALNKEILPLWGITAGSSHLTFLALALALNKIQYFLYFSFVAANLWIIFVYTIQRSINKTLQESPSE